ncbi:MAG: chromosomal replication initiator protein DnaA [Firmicutes bacterium]|nr:chromosomal replication initiator protein DnaA [Bacillota bacterium]
MKNKKQVWEEVLKLLEIDLTPISYQTWFAPLKPTELNEELKILYLESPEEFSMKVIRDRYMENLQHKVETVLKEPYRVILQLEPDEDEKEEREKEKQKQENEENAPAAGENSTEQPTQLLKDEFYFNPRYNFENFVVGNNNKYAYAAAVAVADAPSLAYNPLFLYGGSGLGKTHLMHAIGHYIMEHYPEKSVLYVSSEMFTNELIKSLEDKKKARIRAFKNKYRNVDVLLIDDIQFIEGKEATQEEFFHTFNTLYDLNKQIIISSDRAPNKLTKLEDRLTSRFQWNMIADIQPPDYETRVAILKRKAELENVEIDEDLFNVITLIAEKVKFNIRELEGAFTRVTSLSTMLEERVTVKFAKNVLKDIFSGNDTAITCESIKGAVCRRFNIKASDIESSKRTRNLAYPRQIAMYLCRDMTNTSLPKIGDAFGGRDHTTVLHAYEKISAEIKTNESTADVVKALREEISGN